MYSDTADRLDAVHARHIEDVPGLKIVWSEGKHALIRTLRATGELERVLHAACAG